MTIVNVHTAVEQERIILLNWTRFFKGSANPGITYSRSYSYTNSAAKKTTVMNANRVTLFAYAGHGFTMMQARMHCILTSLPVEVQ